jgi:ADP-heptose:LPS heptosyltransferase
MLIDLLDNPSRTSARFVKYVKAKSSLGFDHHEITPYTITAKLPKKSKTHPAERLLSIAHALGLIYSYEEYTYSFAFSEKSENYAQNEITEKFKGKSILGINLSGSSDSKFWGVKNTIELCKYINQKYQDIQIILFADASKSKVAIEIQDYCSAVYIPSETLYDFAACISKCDCLISPDTSSVHLASAYHIPTLAMYEVHDKNKYGMPWLPYKVAYRSIENPGPISEIDIEKVSSAFDELWNEIIKNKKD